MSNKAFSESKIMECPFYAERKFDWEMLRKRLIELGFGEEEISKKLEEIGTKKTCKAKGATYLLETSCPRTVRVIDIGGKNRYFCEYVSHMMDENGRLYQEPLGLDLEFLDKKNLTR